MGREHDPHSAPTLTCPACGVTFGGRGGDACPRCGALTERLGLPWQVRREEGYTVLGAWARTMWATCRQPQASFSDMRLRQGYRQPLCFLLVALSFAALGVLPLELGRPVHYYVQYKPSVNMEEYRYEYDGHIARRAPLDESERSRATRQG